jgi:hypothetical protein
MPIVSCTFHETVSEVAELDARRIRLTERLCNSLHTLLQLSHTLGESAGTCFGTVHAIIADV